MGVNEVINRNDRIMAACQIHTSATVLFYMTERQREAITNLLLRFEARTLRMVYQPFELPAGYIGGTINGNFEFGCSSEGEISS